MTVAAVICASLLIALVLVLRHLRALHLTKTQMDALRDEMDKRVAAIGLVISPIARDLEDTKARLSALGNRVR